MESAPTAQMKKSVIVKCRQQEANALTSNGTYNTVLKNPILLEEGDIVNIKTAIIDASVDSLISIPELTTVRMDIGKYVMNTNFDVNKKAFTTAAGAPAGFPAPVAPDAYSADVDNQIYILGHGTTASVDNVIKIESITVFPIHKNGIHDMGGLTLSFIYNEVGGLQRKLIWSKFMGLHIQQNFPKGFVIPVGIFSEDGGFTLELAGLKLSDYKIKNITVQRATVPEPLNTNYIMPQIETLEFDIQPGRYTPGEISTVINDAISINETTPAGMNSYADDKWPVVSPCLTTIGQNKFQVDEDPKKNGQFFIRALEYDPNNFDPITRALIYSGSVSSATDAWIGSNQMAINFDANLNKLNFDIIHFPIYVTNPGDTTGSAIPGVTYLRGSPVLAYSGVFVTGLKPASFWQKQLGFTTMPVSWAQQDASFQNDSQATFPFNLLPAIGTNITGAFNGIDLPVQHTADFYRPPLDTAEIPNVATSLTTPIISDRQFDKSPNDEGFYLVEIGFKFPQQMISGSNGAMGAQNNNRVQSIVGKYYTSGNFLQDTGAGSIAYEHRGEPQLLTDLQISIRHPNGTIPSPTEIGPDNSIFIEIVKELATTPN